MKRFSITIILSGALSVMYGQDVLTPVLQQIEQNSTTLKTLRQEAEAEKLQNKSGLTPANPEIEFGYLWGNRAAAGNRKDVSVSQSFDFPTAYIRRSRLSDLQNNSIELRYRTERMHLLLEAKRICIELIYNNMLHKLYAAQHANAQKIAAAYEKMIQNGETTRLEHNKANLNLAATDNALRRVSLKREQLLAELAAMNGGQFVELNADEYVMQPLPADFEQWYASAETHSPSLQYLRSEVEVSRCRVKVSQAEGMPKMNVGYMGEFVGSERFQGLTIGLSVPLWQNKNRVRQARAAVSASESAAEDSRIRYYNYLRSLYNRAVGLQQCVERYSVALSTNSSEALLAKALEGGELTLLEYLLETEHYNDCFLKLADAQKELAHVIAELTAVTL